MRHLNRRIIVTASTYPRWKDDGVPTFVHDQLIFMKKNYPEIEITTLAPHHDGAKTYEKTEYGEIFRFKYFFPVSMQKLVYPAIMPNLKQSKWLFFQIPFLMIFEFFALLNLVLRKRPDYIYSHWFIPQGIVGAIVGILTGTKHVYTSHSSDVMIANKIPLLGRMMVRFCSKKSARISVVSQRSHEKLMAFFSDTERALIKDKIRKIPMGVDTESFAHLEQSTDAIKKKYGYAEKHILFFIGRLVEKKGVRYLLEALPEYVKAYPEAKLVIAGDGPSLKELKAKAEVLDIREFVDFVGYTLGEKKLELLTACDVLLLPSIVANDGDAEGFPVVLIEGLALGKVCVATDVSGADEVLEDGVNGFLIQQKNSSQIQDALLQIKALSEEEKNNISYHATRKSKALDWNTIVKQHVEHLFA